MRWIHVENHLVPAYNGTCDADLLRSRIKCLEESVIQLTEKLRKREKQTWELTAKVSEYNLSLRHASRKDVFETKRI